MFHPQGKKGITAVAVWREAKDVSSGKIYYFNTKTGETRWDRPT